MDHREAAEDFAIPVEAESASRKTIDNLLCREMMKLSVEQRNDIHEEIHGVRNVAREETPELLEHSLKEFGRAFDKIKERANHEEIQQLTDYDYYRESRCQSVSFVKQWAEDSNRGRDSNDPTPSSLPSIGTSGVGGIVTVPSTFGPEDKPGMEAGPQGQSTLFHFARPQQQKLHRLYVEKESFRAVFLRCELFDAKRAAERYLHFLNTICDLFGTGVLERPLDIDRDLTREEVAWLKKGHHQLLPFRDRAGRRIFACVADLGFALESTVRLKIVMYLLCKAAEDIDTQRTGIIMVMFPAPTLSGNLQPEEDGDQHKVIAQSNMLACQTILNSMPTRIAAFHMCLPDTKWYRMFPSLLVIYNLGSSSNRKRFLLHIGKPTELKYVLNSYGIPTEHIPITETGKIKNKHMTSWIRLRQILDKDCYHQSKHDARYNSSSDSSVSSDLTGKQTIVDCPGCSDVLFRSGKAAMVHWGNFLLRDMTETVLDRYIVGTFAEKKEIVVKLISGIYSIGGRFLIWDKNGWWKTTTGEQTYKKVTTFVRNYKSRRKAEENLQRHDSSTYAFVVRNGTNKRKRKEVAVADTVTRAARHLDFGRLQEQKTVANCLNPMNAGNTAA